MNVSARELIDQVHLVEALQAAHRAPKNNPADPHPMSEALKKATRELEHMAADYAGVAPLLTKHDNAPSVLTRAPPAPQPVSETPPTPPTPDRLPDRDIEGAPAATHPVSGAQSNDANHATPANQTSDAHQAEAHPNAPTQSKHDRGPHPHGKASAAK